MYIGHPLLSQFVEKGKKHTTATPMAIMTTGWVNVLNLDISYKSPFV